MHILFLAAYFHHELVFAHFPISHFIGTDTTSNYKNVIGRDSVLLNLFGRLGYRHHKGVIGTQRWYQSKCESGRSLCYTMLYISVHYWDGFRRGWMTWAGQNYRRYLHVLFGNTRRKMSGLGKWDTLGKMQIGNISVFIQEFNLYVQACNLRARTSGLQRILLDLHSLRSA